MDREVEPHAGSAGFGTQHLDRQRLQNALWHATDNPDCNEQPTGGRKNRYRQDACDHQDQADDDKWNRALYPITDVTEYRRRDREERGRYTGQCGGVDYC